VPAKIFCALALDPSLGFVLCVFVRFPLANLQNPHEIGVFTNSAFVFYTFDACEEQAKIKKEVKI